MQVYERVAAHAGAGHFMGGSCFWCLTAADYPDYDGFKISFGQHSAQKAASPDQKHSLSSAAMLPFTGTEPGERESKRCRQHFDQAAVQHGSHAASMEAVGTVSEDKVHVAASDHQWDQEHQQGSCKHDPSPTRYQHLSSSHMLRRVSSRTEGNVEAAAAIFDGDSTQTELQAAHLGAETMYLITEHASAMHALNQHGAGRNCLVM